MRARRNTSDLIANLRRASPGVEVPPPVARDPRTEMRADAEHAERIARILSPHDDTDQEELAESVDGLAGAVHLLATVVLRLLDGSRGKAVP
jgi:hypothetical protein